jgi:hypothetical protein
LKETLCLQEVDIFSVTILGSFDAMS